MTRWRLVFVSTILSLALGAGLAVAPRSEAGGQAGFGCSQGFDLGALTLEQTFNLPRVGAGLAAGAYDNNYVVSSFNATDHNGNGVICFKDVAALNGGAGPWQYVYNIVDDKSSAST